ncbi:hypothetical protein PITCH_A1280039 [uncultured Desulfobacterium sp.]|uniref:Uncharacterized protein n=1 Tax=uncultured Desulfobacterium sp. TaxID=201089 RepID=A0A445MS71_9BACT|nr:hypothetical protein PITCH_A1280039 [uncultured Desulfobacterium sp.]
MVIQGLITSASTRNLQQPVFYHLKFGAGIPEIISQSIKVAHLKALIMHKKGSARYFEPGVQICYELFFLFLIHCSPPLRFTINVSKTEAYIDLSRISLGRPASLSLKAAKT